MRSATDNPFTPGYGVVPQVFAGRQPEFADFEGVVLRRVAEGIYEPARLLTGDRGMGKTALLKQFEAEAREASHWVVRVSAVRGDAVIADLLEALANVLVAHDATTGLGREARAALKRVAGLVIGRTGVTVQEAPRKGAMARAHKDLTEILVDVGRLARKRGTALLLLLDEAQNIDKATIGALFHAFQEAQGQTVTEEHESGATLRAHLPLAVYVAGLPGLPSALRAAGSTFGERAHRIELGLLSEGDVAEALTAFAAAAGVTVDADATDRFVELVGGYPYFLHVLGSATWNAGEGTILTIDDVEAGWKHAAPTIDMFYEERLRDLTETQRHYLEAMAALPLDERTSGNVARALGSSTEAVGSTQQALIETHGIVRRAGRGRIAFTLPGIDRHLLETA